MLKNNLKLFIYHLCVCFLYSTLFLNYPNTGIGYIFKDLRIQWVVGLFISLIIMWSYFQIRRKLEMQSSKLMNFLSVIAPFVFTLCWCIILFVFGHKDFLMAGFLMSPFVLLGFFIPPVLGLHGGHIILLFSGSIVTVATYTGLEYCKNKFINIKTISFLIIFLIDWIFSVYYIIFKFNF